MVSKLKPPFFYRSILCAFPVKVRLECGTNRIAGNLGAAPHRFLPALPFYFKKLQLDAKNVRFFADDKLL
jgi:hypothetical protein